MGTLLALVGWAFLVVLALVAAVTGFVAGGLSLRTRRAETQAQRCSLPHREHTMDDDVASPATRPAAPGDVGESWIRVPPPGGHPGAGF